jgi:hypothetical protein
MNIFCTVGPDELSHPTNDSAYYIAAVTGDPYDYVTLSSYSLGYQWGIKNDSSSASRGNYYLHGVQKHKTFVTTIGLYDDDNNCVAVGKLAQPIRRPFSMPMTFKLIIDFT